MFILFLNNYMAIKNTEVFLTKALTASFVSAKIDC